MAYDDNNVFARILRGEIPAHRVYEDERCLAFMDVMPQTEGHTLVIPKFPARGLFDLPPEQLTSLIVATQKVASGVRAAFEPDGLAIMQFNGAASGQTVFHIHFHILPRYMGKDLNTHAREVADGAVLKGHAAKIRTALAAL